MSNTISVTTTPIKDSSDSSVNGNSGSSNRSAAAQIKSIHKEIERLMEVLSTLIDSGLSPEELRKQIKQIEAQIAMLWAQIAQIQAKEAEKAAEKAKEKEKDNNNASTLAADGINLPTDQNQIDVYI